MPERTLVASATNLLARGYLVVPTDRTSRDGAPVNGLFAVAQAIARVVAMKQPERAVAIVDTSPHDDWPELLKAQVPQLPELLRTLGLHVVETDRELDLAASYAQAAADAGDDVIIAAVDKRFAQLVDERRWWFDANKNVRYTTEIVQKRFNVPPSQVADWLALVGDQDQLAGVKGIGAKGATDLLTEHGSLAAAIEKLDAMEGRLAKALKASRDELEPKRAQAHLDTKLPLPNPLAECAYQPAPVPELNALLERLGFLQLLVPEDDARRAKVCTSEAELSSALARFKGQTVAMHLLLEDPAPVVSAPVGVGLSVGEGEPLYVAVDGGAWPALTRWLEDAEVPKSGHDLVESMVALRRHGVHLRGVVSDSACESHLTEPSNWATHELALVARQVLGRALPEDDEVRGTGKSRKPWSRLPPARVAEVAGQRAEASAAISRKLLPGVEPKLLQEYLALEDTLVRMELKGLALDVEELGRAEAAFAEIEAELEKEITALAGHAFNINSSKQLGTVLFEELKLPVVLHTKTGWSTANEALERIEQAHPIVTPVLRWRNLRRLKDSWLVALKKSVHDDGRVHSRFSLARSFSGHLVNSNPDLGRVPGRTPEMARVRRAFVAAKGHLLMSVDFQQLGLYVLAHLTKDPALVEPLRKGEDMHRLTAAAVLEVPPESLTLAQRQVGKVVNFATFAGQGASSLGQQLGISAQEARAYIERFDRHYAGVRAFQDEQLRLAKERGYITTIAGRRWPIGGLESLDPMLGSYAERLARRATHEGSVSDVSRRALLEADRALLAAGLKAAPVVQILDEVLFEVPEAELQQAAAVASKAMCGAFTLEVPLVVGVEVGPNWADLEPLSTK